jgi:glycosyltransferase involved in cell wall biosynthesis
MSQKSNIRVALVVPHIFLHRDILPNVIFSPGTLALELAKGLNNCNIDVTLFTPGPVDTSIPNITADMSYFETELAGRCDTYIDLLKKHQFIFVSLARQVQSELIAKAYAAANNNEYDLVHIYTNEEDIALPFAKLCKKPVVFTHHDPFNFLIRYKSIFPKYPQLNWLSLSLAQRSGMPANTNWVGNIYHGLNPDDFKAYADEGERDYIAYLGRIIEPKGLHLAIDAVNKYNETALKPITLKIAGKHYSDSGKDTYWQQQILPRLNENIKYIGFIKEIYDKNTFLGDAKALIIPSTFNEPFGMVMIESLASGTPVIGLNSGAIPEVINKNTGILVQQDASDIITVERLSHAIQQIDSISRQSCRNEFEARFTLERMCQDHAEVYRRLTESPIQL